MTLSAADAWARLIDRSRDHLPAHTIDQWLAPLTPLEFDGQRLTLAAPDQFAVDWVSSKHSAYLESLAPICLGHPCALTFRVQEERRTRSQMDLFVPQNEATIEPVLADNTVILSQLNERYSFDHFVIGKSNELAAAAAAAVAEAPGKSYNPLFIYGATGLGKTHLMQAIAHRIIQRDPSVRVTYITAEQFLNDVINSIETRSMNEFKRRYRQSDLLLVDDVHVLAGKQQTQEEFFHTFNALHESMRQIVIASDRPPKELAEIEDRLRSRFEWGLIADIQPPDLETKVAILQKKAESDQVTLPTDVALFIASNVRTNVRELEGAMTRLVAWCQHNQMEITLPNTQQCLKQFIDMQVRKVTIEAIQRAVAEQFGMKVSDLKQKNNSRNVVVPRQIAMYLAKQMTEASLPEIGRQFGNKHHTTVMHSIGKIDEQRRTDKDLHRTLNKLQDQLNG